MQMRRVTPLPGGRLQIEASAISRFEVVSPTQSLPYSRADVRLLPDDEEVELARAAITLAPFPLTEAVGPTEKQAGGSEGDATVVLEQ